jgi:hypothetical protein
MASANTVAPAAYIDPKIVALKQTILQNWQLLPAVSLRHRRVKIGSFSQKVLLHRAKKFLDFLQENF